MSRNRGQSQLCARAAVVRRDSCSVIAVKSTGGPASEASSFDLTSSGLKSTFRLGKSLSMKRRVTSRPRTRVMMSNVLPRFSSTRDTPRFTVETLVTSCGWIDVSNGKAFEEIEELMLDVIDHDMVSYLMTGSHDVLWRAILHF